MFRRTITAALSLIACAVAYSDRAPIAYVPSVEKRINYSDVVCSATILKTGRTGRQVTIEGADRDEFMAQAEVSQVFKGALAARSIRFRYFGFGPFPSPDYMHPPTASFATGSRYILFLKHNNESFVVAIPVWQMEIPLAPRPSSEARSVSPSLAGIAEELFHSVQSSPKTLGRNASRYFDWAEQIIGKDAIPKVEAFLNSDDKVVRYETAWWLSFRRITDSVMKVLIDASNDSNIEEWARTGARGRLKDITEGNWVPK